MTDPFDIEAHPPFVMNISTGMHATREVQDSLLSAGNEGEKSAETLLTKGVSHGFVQMVYYCLDLFLISLQSCLLHFFM
jgi:hypothetical protein